MNDYEMMNQRVDQLRLKLAEVHKWEAQNQRLKEDIMNELLDTRRQITRADKQNKVLPSHIFLEGEFRNPPCNVDWLI